MKKQHPGYSCRWRGRIPVPRRAHPLVRQLIRTINAEGMTLRELAEISGISVQTLSDWRYRGSPTLHLFIAALNAVGHDLTIVPTGEKPAAQTHKELLFNHEVDAIKKRVSEAFNYPEYAFAIKYGGRKATLPRQIAMWLCNTMTVMSLSEIGRHFGFREHTGVRQAIYTAGVFLERDTELRNKVGIIQAELGGGA
ncbi:hypothetical protein LCGC14_1346740 [marine sediment metagenome]|uniref:HTH cro/C1-type domain-containing protein n=1 Tax=marine sediment metagenome TaxID=412755 RepID=A0A0F9MSR8_9ZZZZ